MVLKFFAFLVLCSIATGSEVELETEKKPLYKYRYETEDVMKTAASSIPVRGYHVVEGGYYPEAGVGAVGGGVGGAGGAGIRGDLVGAGSGYGGKFIGGPIGYGGIGVGGLGLRGAGIGLGGYGGGLGLGYGGVGIGGGGLVGPEFAGRYTGPIYGGYGGYGGGIGGIGGGGIGGAGIGGVGIGGGGIGGGGIGGVGIGGVGIGGVGGEYIDKNVYDSGKKNLKDAAFEQAKGQKGEEISHEKEGFSKGLGAIKNSKGESALYNEEGKGKKAFEDEKAYQGAQHFNKQGKEGGELNHKSGHKKGHVIKGFKTSHHKDESGKTEEYYDEENDEGGKLNYNNNFGAFGQNAGSSYKGGHENGNLEAGAHKKEGHYNNEHIIDNANADKGSYGSRKYAGSGSTFGANNGIDKESLLGHQEASRFYKHHPHVPFY